MTIEAFPDFLRENWKEIRKFLMEGKYQPSPVLRVEIPYSLFLFYNTRLTSIIRSFFWGSDNSFHGVSKKGSKD